VVQQRHGVQLAGGVGASGDVYERHADAVADVVVRGESAEALLDQHAGGERAGVQRAVQRDPGDEPVRRIEYSYVPRELPSQAGRQLQAALLRGIPADKRHDDGQTLLALLPGLANILDPAITAAERGLIVDRGSAWHPASYEGDHIPTPPMWALWDYYKARWESDDLATRRGHVELGLSHWHPLLLPRTFNEYVDREHRSEIRSLITSLIEQPARRLRSNRTFDVLTHNGNALSAEELAARERRRTEAAAARRSRGGGAARSERVDVAREDVHVTDGEARTARYINPDALRYVPHQTSGGSDPRRVAFNPLAAVLNDLIAAEGNPAAIAEVQTRLAAEETATRERMRVYVRRHRHGAELTAALADIDSMPLTVEVEVQSHDVDVGMFRVHLEPVAPGALVERPGGYRASTTEIATGRTVTGSPTPEVMESVVGSFSGDQQTIARQYLEVIRRGEGSMTSLNTWDRLRITLGSGVGAAGRLQDRFAQFQAAEASEDDGDDAYERLFGRHGVGVEARGMRRDGRGTGNSVFRTTGADGGALEGTEATEAMANDPATLGVMVAAGFDPAWQTFLLRGGAESLQRAFNVSFTCGDDGAVTLAEGGGGTNLYSWLHGHVPANVLSAAMFAIADDFHGSGHLSGDTASGFGPQYQAAMTASGGDAAHPEAAPDPARLQVATWLVTARSHPNRRRHIAAALGVGSYDSIAGGG
jgi:hypothetical protein